MSEILCEVSVLKGILLVTKLKKKMLLVRFIINIVALLPEHSLTKKWLYSGPEILSAGWMDPGLVEGSPVQVKVER